MADARRDEQKTLPGFGDLTNQLGDHVRDLPEPG